MLGWLWLQATRLYYYLFDRLICYPLLKWAADSYHIEFMNLGYAGDDQPINALVREVLTEGDPIEPHILLYEKTLSFVPSYPSLEGARILEVGCGQGGGVKWIQRAHPRVGAVRGVDRVVVDDLDGRIITGTRAVTRRVAAGDALRLPFSDNSFDIIVNVESSHLYSNNQQFFDEVSWGDSIAFHCRYAGDEYTVRAQAQASALEQIAFHDITKNVLNGIQFTSRRYDAMMAKAPWFLRLFSQSIRDTYCAVGTHTHARYVRGEKKYWSACWRNDKRYK